MFVCNKSCDNRIYFNLFISQCLHLSLNLEWLYSINLPQTETSSIFHQTISADGYAQWYFWPHSSTLVSVYIVIDACHMKASDELHPKLHIPVTESAKLPLT
jgi:hypothetical protein